MNTLRKSKQTVYRCKYLGESERRDERGVIIGRFPNYSSPDEMFLTISMSHNKNSSFYHKKIEREKYGVLSREDAVINTTSDTDITENDVFFIERDVSFDDNGIPEYNYIVSGITKGPEFALISLARVQRNE